jgi:hypothetical protein
MDNNEGGDKIVRHDLDKDSKVKYTYHTSRLMVISHYVKFIILGAFLFFLPTVLIVTFMCCVSNSGTMPPLGERIGMSVIFGGGVLFCVTVIFLAVFMEFGNSETVKRHKDFCDNYREYNRCINLSQKVLFKSDNNWQQVLEIDKSIEVAYNKLECFLSEDKSVEVKKFIELGGENHPVGGLDCTTGYCTGGSNFYPKRCTCKYGLLHAGPNLHSNTTVVKCDRCLRLGGES